MNNRRKFRSQTFDNMDRWKAEMGRVREEKKKNQKETSPTTTTTATTATTTMTATLHYTTIQYTNLTGAHYSYKYKCN